MIETDGVATQAVSGAKTTGVTTSAQSYAADERVAVDPNAWPEWIFRCMEEHLEVGHLDIVEANLDGIRFQRITALGKPMYDRRVSQLRDSLVLAKLRETAGGGPGSLVNRDHPLAVYRAACDRRRDELAKARSVERVA